MSRNLQLNMEPYFNVGKMTPLNECIALRREYINGYFVTIALFSFTGVLLTFGGCAVKFSGRAFALNKVLTLADGSLWQATQFE